MSDARLQPDLQRIAENGAAKRDTEKDCLVPAVTVCGICDIAGCYHMRAPDRTKLEEMEAACAKWAEVSQSNYQRAKAAEAKIKDAADTIEKALKDKGIKDEWAWVFEDTLKHLKEGENDA